MLSTRRCCWCLHIGHGSLQNATLGKREKNLWLNLFPKRWSHSLCYKSAPAPPTFRHKCINPPAVYQHLLPSKCNIIEKKPCGIPFSFNNVNSDQVMLGSTAGEDVEITKLQWNINQAPVKFSQVLRKLYKTKAVQLPVSVCDPNWW